MTPVALRELELDSQHKGAIPFTSEVQWQTNEKTRTVHSLGQYGIPSKYKTLSNKLT